MSEFGLRGERLREAHALSLGIMEPTFAGSAGRTRGSAGLPDGLRRCQACGLRVCADGGRSAVPGPVVAEWPAQVVVSVPRRHPLFVAAWMQTPDDDVTAAGGLSGPAVANLP